MRGYAFLSVQYLNRFLSGTEMTEKRKSSAVCKLVIPSAMIGTDEVTLIAK